MGEQRKDSGEIPEFFIVSESYFEREIKPTSINTKK